MMALSGGYQVLIIERSCVDERFKFTSRNNSTKHEVMVDFPLLIINDFRDIDKYNHHTLIQALIY